jgi:hypothetical protein
MLNMIGAVSMMLRVGQKVSPPSVVKTRWLRSAQTACRPGRQNPRRRHCRHAEGSNVIDFDGRGPGFAVVGRTNKLNWESSMVRVLKKLHRARGTGAAHSSESGGGVTPRICCTKWSQRWRIIWIAVFAVIHVGDDELIKVLVGFDKGIGEAHGYTEYGDTRTDVPH